MVCFRFFKTVTVPCLEDVLDDCKSELDAETVANLLQEKTDIENTLACADFPKVIVSLFIHVIS